ncbi:MAG TPA: hypothetical protein VGX68_11705 [Thermoanaerobaculia bacterium]|jgi:hypothetical protein|nr:hypothetical protein [Thermoanaerobaculia bacterium]
MDCGTVRDRLLRGARDASLDVHLGTCADCARFAHRISAAREAFRQPVVPIEPDPGFASRVVARLPRTAEVLGWAALRALPAAFALALTLAWLGWSQPPSAASLLTGEPSPEMILTYGAFATEAGR